jgi:hypothetical protein
MRRANSQMDLAGKLKPLTFQFAKLKKEQYSSARQTGLNEDVKTMKTAA